MPPGDTIGSRRSVAMRPGQGMRQNAEADDARARTLSAEALKSKDLIMENYKQRY